METASFKPWALSEKEILKDLETSLEGLNFKKAKELLQNEGPNVLEESKEKNALEIYLNQFRNPLILILIGATIISFLIGDHLDATIILAMIVINSLLSFFQEYRSEKAANLLKKKTSLKALVVREGKESLIDASQLVKGDIVKISQGSIVPAELRLLQIEELLVNETLITGESFPVEKQAELLNTKENSPQKLTNIAFMGTEVESGKAVGVVFATGSATEYGKTSHSLAQREPETEFQTGTRRFGNLLVAVILTLVVFIFLVNIYLKPVLFGIAPNYLEALLFSLALAIGITPELLPIIITINLSKGAVKMAKKHVIVKKLTSIEDLGNADVLCTDKTGTITEGKIFLENYFSVDNTDNHKLLLYSFLSSPSGSESSVNQPLEKAILDYPGIKEIRKEAETYQTLDETSFDFERKRNAVLVKNRESSFLIAKGATEQILKISTSVQKNGQEIIFNDKLRREVHDQFVQLSSQGLRLLAVSAKKISSQKKISLKDENNLTFLGFLAFSDRPKSTASEIIKDLDALSVKIKILTGDNEFVAKHICEEVGLKVEKVLTIENLEALNDQELSEIAPSTTIFARITPEEKLRIIKALKKAGHTVAFMGDGANDAPALKAADVGVSVDSALDVAKQAADVILLRKSLEVLVEAVKEGRKTFGNSMKYLFAVTSSNFGNMISLAGASLLLPFIPMLPSQVILLNFMGDIPSLAISSDNVDPEYLKKPKHWNIKAIASFMIPFGLISSIFDFSTFFLLVYLTRNLTSPEKLFRSGWFLESLVTEVLVLYLIRTSRAFWASKPSRLLLVLGFGSILAGIAIIFSPFGNLFQFTLLPKNFIFLIALLVVLYLVIVGIAKRIYYRYFGY